MSAQLESLRRQPAPRPRRVRRVEEGGPLVFGSGKGGSGTSTLAGLLAVGASSAGSRVLLVDGNAGFGSLHMLMGVDAGEGWTALKRGAAAEDLLITVDARLTLLPAGGDGDPGAATVSSADRQALFRKISALYAAYDLVLVDGGSRLDSVIAACTPGAARLFAISTADRVSLAATYALLKVVDSRLPALPVSIVINRGEAAAADSIRGAARRFLGRDMDPAGSVPDDECLRAGIDAGMTIQDAAVGSPAAAAVLELATRFVRRPHAASAAVDPLLLSRRS